MMPLPVRGKLVVTPFTVVQDSNRKMTKSFLTDYFKYLVNCVGNDHSGNFDTARFGALTAVEPARARLSRRASHWLAQVGLMRKQTVRSLVCDGLSFASPWLAELEWLYSSLEDEESRAWLTSLIAYRALGHRYVKLATNQPRLWEGIRKIESLVSGSDAIYPKGTDFQLRKLDLGPLGIPIVLFFSPGGCQVQFVDQQYRCVAPDVTVEAGSGDIVIDAGGCWGDTALYFANRCGPSGKVYSFEFLPDNLEIFRRNLDLNPQLKSRITLVEHPLWSASDQELYVQGSGPGTSVGPTRTSPDALTVTTLSIDDLVARNGLPRVDFIKMDIEGAELPALRGATVTLRRFRPKLAVTVYHSLSDFWSIPRFLSELNLGYRFFLRHFTIHAEETVLYAYPAKRE